MDKSETYFYLDEKKIGATSFSDVHKKKGFIEFIENIANKCQVVVVFPVINWKFDNQSISDFIKAINFTSIVDGKTPIAVHIPEIQKEEIIKSNTIVFYQVGDKIYELTPDAAKSAYTKKTGGENIQPPKNYNFVTVSYFYVTH